VRRTTRSDRPRRRLSAVLLAAAGAGSLVTTACSGSGPDAAPDTTQTAATGTIAENVDIGDGRSIYIECHGEGSPTVLLLSGAGTASDLWHAPDQKGPKVYDEIGTETLVCALDRPGVQSAPCSERTFGAF
jgi:hypothetical protein